MALDTFPGHKSHAWLVATILDGTDVDKAYICEDTKGKEATGSPGGLEIFMGC